MMRFPVKGARLSPGAENRLGPRALFFSPSQALPGKAK